MASTYLTRTEANFGTATNRKKCTISFWLKKSLLTSQQAVMGVETTPAGGSNEARIVLKSDDTFEFYDYQSGYTFRYKTNRLLRDTSAYYHIVLTVDTTQSTTSDRVKIYINGVQETSFSIGTHPNQNLDTFLNSGAYVQIGRQSTGNSYFDGLISHFHFIDGTAYDASAFGETDTTTGEWKAKTSPSVTYGTNGFLILKDGNTITDQSSNSNDFTLGGGTLTDLKDNPDNVFATFNPLLDVNATPTFSNGNNTFVGTGSTNFAGSSIAVSSGKWYVEFKTTTVNGSYPIAGVIDAQSTKRRDGTFFVGADIDENNPSGFACFSSGEIYHNNSSSFGNLSTTYTSGDIIGMALNMDSATKTLAFYKNGNLQTTINLDEPPSGAYIFATGAHSSTASAKAEANFGNGYFGTTAVSSAGTNASDNGIFEYDVPTGYTALSTKGLNE
jgi:hypothetical protein